MSGVERDDLQHDIGCYCTRTQLILMRLQPPAPMNLCALEYDDTRIGLSCSGGVRVLVQL